MSAREAMLVRIRRSLGVTGNEVDRNATIDDRLRQAPSGVVPARGQLPPGKRLALFTEMAERASADVVRVKKIGELPAAVADYLRSQNLPAALRIGEAALLAELSWDDTQIAVSRGASAGDDPVGLSHAFAAVAETGTLIIASGSSNPTTLGFLPEVHIVAVKAADVVGDYEAAWQKLRDLFGKGRMPVTVNMITGPARSADIEQTIHLGAHGPRRLAIVVVG